MEDERGQRIVPRRKGKTHRPLCNNYRQWPRIHLPLRERCPGTHTFPFLGGPTYFQCPGTKTPPDVVWGFIHTEFGPGFGGLAYPKDKKRKGEIVMQTMRNILNRLNMGFSFPPYLVATE